MREIDRSSDFPRRDVDHVDPLPVGARLADSGISVNRDVHKTAVGRSDHLVSRHAVLGYSGYLPAGLWIDDTEALFALIGHDQQPLSRSGLGKLSRRGKKH
jgi:hypothetical protein